METGTLRVSESIDHLSSTRASELYGSKEELIQSINIMVGQYCKAHLQIASIAPGKQHDINGTRIESLGLGAGGQLAAVRQAGVIGRLPTRCGQSSGGICSLVLDPGRLRWRLLSLSSPGRYALLLGGKHLVRPGSRASPQARKAILVEARA